MTQFINQVQSRPADFGRAASNNAERAAQIYRYIRHNMFRMRNNIRQARMRASQSLTAFVERHPLLGSLSLLFSAPLAVLGFVFAGTSAIVIPVALLLGYAW